MLRRREIYRLFSDTNSANCARTGTFVANSLRMIVCSRSETEIKQQLYERSTAIEPFIPISSGTIFEVFKTNLFGFRLKIHHSSTSPSLIRLLFLTLFIDVQSYNLVSF